MGLGGFSEIQEAASLAGMSVNAFCLERLRRSVEPLDSGQLTVPGIDGVPSPIVDPLQATFRGGLEEPLHGWFPFLEGYSPEFVNTLLNTYAPTARHVLDPFAGTGTTPLTAAARGLRSAYCELNPLLQLLVESKTTVLSLSAGQRTKLADRLVAEAQVLPQCLEQHPRDTRLATTYKATFGKSKFFEPDILDRVLRARSWLDQLACTDSLTAQLATVATVACLLSVSNLIRRGDVRFRKGSEYSKRRDDLGSEVAAKLRAMASDLRSLEEVEHSPLLVAADAKRLGRVPDLSCDVVVTSPPYLNGTNYYRNTKVELWFLRALATTSDLTAFRTQTVTAGINDVTGNRTEQAVNASVGRLVEKLEDQAYDRRIPLMASRYFSDMSLVLKGIRGHLQPGSPLLMDIGDSAYGGVHVDTPGLLGELLEEQGWTLQGEHPLRKRLSRSGQPLRQALLVASAPAKRPSSRSKKTKWQPRWSAFKAALPHQAPAFAKRNWGSPLHSLCSYQGKMKPSLAHHLVKTFLSPNERMVDPFGGVGTIPFEAACRGVTSWSFDISPAAVLIAAAKLQPTTLAACQEEVSNLQDFIASNSATPDEREGAARIRFNGAIPDYYHPRTFDEVLLARRYFHEHPPSSPATTLVFASLLHVLHGNRPYALSRRSHPITPFAPKGPAEYKQLSIKVTEKVERALAAKRPVGFCAGDSLFQDATETWPPEVDKLDAVITSPPFFDSTRFHLTNWLRLWFAGWTEEAFKTRPLAFVDERQKKSFAVYRAVVRQARERLKPGGVCVFHLGKSRKCDMAAELSRVARPWFEKSEVFAESVAHCESHGIRDKGTVREHTYLVLY